MSFTTHLNTSKLDIQKAVNVLTAKVASEAAAGNLETVLWATWHDFLDLAASTPHSEQQPHVDFLQTLRGASDPKRDNGQPYEIWNQAFQWQNLPLLGAQVREELDVEPRGGTPEEHLEKWINKNAFLARLTQASKPGDALDYSLYAVWAIRDVLEEVDASSSLPVKNDPGTVAVWLLYAGQTLKKKSMEGQDFDGRMGKEGDAVGEKGWKGLNGERWEYWIEKLQELRRTVGKGESQNLLDRALQSVKDG